MRKTPLRMGVLRRTRGTHADASVFGRTGKNHTPGAPGTAKNPRGFFLNSTTRSASARCTSGSAAAPYARACVARLQDTERAHPFRANPNGNDGRACFGTARSKSQRHLDTVSAKRVASESSELELELEPSAAFTRRRAHRATRRGIPATTRTEPGAARPFRLRIRHRASFGSRVVSASSTTNTHGDRASKPAFFKTAARRF